jgi:RHS repeat-associated protein
MNGKKPHLMTKYDNGMGKTVELEYMPSTKFYLEDREKGEPWVAKLPFPVHCLSKVVTHDHASGCKFTNSYAYRHGYYDIAEREFRGFGRVDQIDAEDFGKELDQPPVLKRTWFHLGAYAKSEGLLSHYEKEYNSVYESEPRLGQPELKAEWAAEEQREAMRSLKGMPLREEVYALDETELENIPYTTTQFSYKIKRLQPKGGNRHACYIAAQSESLMHHYERNAKDPRVAHSLVLKFDKYMRPKLSAEAVYGREKGFDEQEKNHIIVTETSYARDAGELSKAGAWRMGLECAAKTWELAVDADDIFTRKKLFDEFKNAGKIQFEEEMANGKKRLVEHTETLFYDENLSEEPLEFGKMEEHGLVYESYSLAYTASLLEHLYGDKHIEPSMLAEGGFIKRGEEWWMRTGQNSYAPEAASKFYLPNGFENAFGEKTEIVYDIYNLLMVSVTDPLGNVVTAENDYRTLSPSMITDPNGNKTAVGTDALGIVTEIAVMGKGEEGDTLDDPTMRMEYEFAAPSWIKTSSRETHGVSNTRWLEKVEYSDGMGRVALVKTKAEPGEDREQRWVGTGWTVLNNKGNPVKQYEPYFSNTCKWENEDDVKKVGVTPLMHYDPLGRLVKTEFPDKTFSKVEFTAWEQIDCDRNDTVLESDWHKSIKEPGPDSTPEEQAAWRAALLAAKHANTPKTTHLDSLGRAFYAIEDDGSGKKPSTRTVLDIEGNEKEIIVTRTIQGVIRDLSVMKYKYGIHGEKGYTESMDAGKRWMLLAADGQPMYTWDSRGRKLHFEYDELRRPTKQWLNDGALVGMTVYGESAENNLIGQPWKIYDQSGMVENVKFDFKGNLLESRRRFTTEYKETINWNVSDPNALLQEEEFASSTEYDALNRATNLHTPHNGNIPASEIMPEYDGGGLLKGVKAKLMGTENSTNFVTDITYNPKGQRERIRYGNGSTTRYEYDEKTFRLTNLLTTRNNGEDKLQDLNYKYDPMGNITEIEDESHQTIYFSGSAVKPSQKFEYDALYRLTKATGREHAQNDISAREEGSDYPQGLIQYPLPSDATALRNYVREWEYDEVGNIMSLIHSANGNTVWSRSYDYAQSSNQLMSTKVGNNAVSYTYNEHGSMTKMPHLQVMDWDFAERLIHVTKGIGTDTTEAYYNYDGSSERTRKVVEKNNGAVVETRLYLGGFEIWRKKVNGNIDTERETLHIMDDVKRVALVEMRTYENRMQIVNPIVVQRYQLSNNIESSALELDENANIISYEEYYPYGDTSYQAVSNISEVSQKRYRYTGKEKDEESGLYYHGARYYADWLGRWTAADPAGLVDGINIYMYCSGNPIKYVDPNGHERLVVSGGYYNNNKDKKYQFEFIDSALKESTSYSGKEKSTLLIANVGLTEIDKKKVEEYGKDYNFNVVYFDDVKEINKYINEGSDSNREGDPITEFRLFAHGKEGSIEFGYDSGLSEENQEKLRWTIDKIKKLEKDVFENTYSVFYSCNTGTPVDAETIFAQEWSNITGGETKAAKGQTTYKYIHGIKSYWESLPTENVIESLIKWFLGESSVVPQPAFESPELGSKAKWEYFNPIEPKIKDEPQ